jgi:hypothetical protein
MVLGEQQPPLRRRLRAEAEEAQGGEGKGDTGKPEEGVVGDGWQDGGQQFVPQQVCAGHAGA